MGEITQVPQQQNISLDVLYKSKGELITQLEIIQNKLQQVNNQLAQLLNIQAKQSNQ